MIMKFVEETHAHICVRIRGGYYLHMKIFDIVASIHPRNSMVYNDSLKGKSSTVEHIPYEPSHTMAQMLVNMSPT